MRKTTESDVLRDCLYYLKVGGILAWRTNNTGIYDPVKKRFRAFQGLRGVSDILGILAPSGRLLAVETKGPTGRLTPEQKVFLDRVRAAGGLALVVRDVDELVKALEVEFRKVP